jgi:hypothetical protein
VESCERLIAITVPEYEQVRGKARQFAVTADPVAPDLERIVDESERFVIVLERQGTPADVANAEDPRS